MSDPWIIDVGLHHGEDTDFYLRKGFRVVAIEANPRLAARCRERFAGAIAEGRLEILEGAVSDEPGEIEFTVNLDKDDWSSLDPAVGGRQGSRTETIRVPAIRFDEVLRAHAPVRYIKCDIERGDIFVINALHRTGLCPPLFSVEAHEAEYLAHLAVLGYDRFKLVNQITNWQVKLPEPALEGRYVEHTFPKHSSGAFGEEVPGAWMSFLEVAEVYASIRRLQRERPGLMAGYFDFHAKHRDA